MAKPVFSSFDSSNIIDIPPVRWQIYVYPLLALAVLGGLGTGAYIYQQQAREAQEETARAALVAATTPEQKLDVAKNFAGTDQAVLALLSAGHDFYDKKNFPAAEQAFAQIETAYPHHPLTPSAELGQAVVLENEGKAADALNFYLQVVHLGSATPFVTYAAVSAARIYQQQGKIAEARQILQTISATAGTSAFSEDAKILTSQLIVVPKNAEELKSR